MNDIKIQKRSKRKKRRELIQYTANYLIKELKKEGIVVQRYNSKTSHSIYLKLDYGVLPSIRISDHKSKETYKYNVLTICQKPVEKTFNGMQCYFIPLKDKQLLIDMIRENRRELLSYGKENYQTFMNIKIAENYAKTGFWQCGEINVNKGGIDKNETKEIILV